MPSLSLDGTVSDLTVILSAWLELHVPIKTPLCGSLGPSWFPHSIFHRGVQELKKVENVSRSPWFSHITSSMQGLGVIHAYDKKEDCINK